MTNITDKLDKVLAAHSEVVESGLVAEGAPLKYKSYAISTLRGGVGKSTLAFNLAYEISKSRPILVADVCAQCNLTETLRRDAEQEVTILDALQPMLLGPAFGEAPDDISYRISNTCDQRREEHPDLQAQGGQLPHGGRAQVAGERLGAALSARTGVPR